MNLIIVPTGEGTKDPDIRLIMAAKPIDPTAFAQPPSARAARQESPFSPFNRNKPGTEEPAKPAAQEAGPSILEM